MALGSSFDTVLQAARTGADWAWARIYDDLAPALLRYLTLRGASEPEDLLGDVFVSIVRALSSFEGTEPEFRAWAFKMARNGLIDSWRREGRRRVDYLPDIPASSAGAAPSAEAVALLHDSHQRVVAVLAALTADQRDVVYLRIVAGLTLEQVSRVVGKPVTAVKSLQWRAIATIRKKYPDWPYPGE
jgi:RNA polymerase sigma-70 factor (ECF subfamily)